MKNLLGRLPVAAQKRVLTAGCRGCRFWVCGTRNQGGLRQMIQVQLTESEVETKHGRMIQDLEASGVDTKIWLDEDGYYHIEITDGSGDGFQYDLFCDQDGDILLSRKGLE